MILYLAQLVYWIVVWSVGGALVRDAVLLTHVRW